MRRLPLLLATMVLVVACGGGSTAVRSTPERARGAAATRDSLAGPWTLRNPGRPRAQLVTLSAVLQSRVDSISREDTVASQSLLEWSVVPDAEPTRIVGMLREFSMIVGADSTWQAPDDPPMPVSFVAVQATSDAQPSLVTPADTACSSRAAVVQALRETWLAPPARLSIGTRWRDSSAYPICRDGIVLQVQSVRDYVVEGATVRDGRLAIKVRRSSRTTLEGRGLQFGDSIAVTGEGEATASLDLSLDGAAILSGSGASELRLQMRGRRRTQELVQHGALVIRTP